MPNASFQPRVALPITCANTGATRRAPITTIGAIKFRQTPKSELDRWSIHDDSLQGLFIYRSDPKFYDTNLTPAVAPRFHTSSHFLAVTLPKENASRNSFGSGIWSC